MFLTIVAERVGGSNMSAVSKFLCVLAGVSVLASSGLARAADEFSFVVIGETRGPKPAAAATGFTKARDEINFLKPALVVNLGNVILGHTKDKELLNREWEVFEKIRGTFDATCFLAVGNHDVFDIQSQREFMRRYGPLWYSFNHGSAHFIVLNSEIVGETGKIDGKQLAWLRLDLERNSKKAKQIFVFVHRPVWVYPATSEHWMTNVHPLLAKNGVDVVFAGHKQVYRREPVKDGVRYYVTGGGGAPLRDEPALGGFEHYLWVTVRADDVDVAVIRTGWLEGDEVVTAEKVRTFREALATLKKLSRPMPFSADPTETAVEAVFNNYAGQPYSVSLSWKAPKQLTVEPSAIAIDVPGGQKKTITAQFSGSCWPIDFMPAYEAVLSYQGSRHVVKDTAFVTRGLDCPYADSPPKIDGSVDDPAWQKAGAGVAKHFYRDTDGGSSGWDTRAMALWDRDNLYVAMVIPEPHIDQLVGKVTEGRDGAIWQDDGVELFFDPGATGKRSWQLAVNCRGAFKDVADNGDARWNPEWQRAVKTGDGSYSIEMAIPFAVMAALVEPGDVWGVNFCRNRQVAPAENSAWCQSRDWRDPARMGRMRFLAPAVED
jgi:hypothetical protein